MNEPERILKSSVDLKKDVESSFCLEKHLNECAHNFFKEKQEPCDVEAVMFFAFFRLFTNMLATVCIRRQKVGEIQDIIHESLAAIRQTVQQHLKKHITNERPDTTA